MNDNLKAVERGYKEVFEVPQEFIQKKDAKETDKSLAEA